MLRGADLISWARRAAMEWWEARHDTTRPPLESIIAGAYLTGAIDALHDETQRIKREGEPHEIVQGK